VSIILVLMQGFVVQHWCFFCLVTAAISLTLIFLAYDEVVSSCIYLYEIKKRSSWKTTWWAFWGYPSPEALAAGEATLQQRSKKNVGPDL
ncbi:MAG: vitamin K epoxide reductase, partial [Verrucomicrobia bacterium]|nr:vitamin K epoxide reductase [Verrucomicrobiota bacterium]